MSVGRSGYAPPSQEMSSSAPATLHVASDPDGEVKSRQASANGDPWHSGKPPVMTERTHPQPTALMSSAGGGGGGGRVASLSRSTRRFLIAGVGLPPGDATLADGGGAYSDNSCSVCLDEYAEGDQLLQLTCGHVFHRPCIDLWLMEHRVCPCCRTDLDKLAQVAQVFPTTSRRSLQKALNRAEGNAVIAVELLLTRRDRRNVRSNAAVDPAAAVDGGNGGGGGDGDSLANNVIGDVIDDVIDDVERATEMVRVSSSAQTGDDGDRGDHAGRVGVGAGGGGGGFGGEGGGEGNGSGVIGNLGARFRRVDSGLLEGRDSRSGSGSQSRSGGGGGGGGGSRSRSRSRSHGRSPSRSQGRSHSSSSRRGGGTSLATIPGNSGGSGSSSNTALPEGVGRVDREAAAAETASGEVDVEIGGGGIRAGQVGAAAGAAAAATAAAVVAASSETSMSRPSSVDSLGGMAGAWAWRRRTASDGGPGAVGTSGRDSAGLVLEGGAVTPPGISASGDALMSARSWDEIVAGSRAIPLVDASSIAAAAASAASAGAGAGAGASPGAVISPEWTSAEAGTRCSSSSLTSAASPAPRWMGLRFSPPRPSPASRLESPAFSPRPEVDAVSFAGSTPGGNSERASERALEGASERASERALEHSVERASERPSEQSLGRASERSSEERGWVEPAAINGSGRSVAKTPPVGSGLASWRSYRASVEAAAAVTQHSAVAAGSAGEEDESGKGFGSRFGRDSSV